LSGTTGVLDPIVSLRSAFAWPRVLRLSFATGVR